MSIVIRVTLPVEVDFEYAPAEPEVGIPWESIEIDHVWIGSNDVTRALTPDDFRAIEEAIWEAREVI